MKSIKDIKQKFESELVTKLSWIWIIVNALVMLAGIVIYSPLSFSRWIYNIIIVSVIGLSALALNRYGHTKIASYVLPGCMFIYITILAYTGGGTILPGIVNFIPIILTTGFLLGRNKGVIMALLCITVIFGLAILETSGLLPEVNFVRSPIGRAIALLLPVSIAATIQYFATKHLSESFVSLQNEMIKREEAEKAKDQLVLDLKERVKELQTLSTVSYILQNKEASLNELFSNLCEVIPGGWQYTEVTAVRILVDDKEYISDNYKPSDYKLFTEIQTIKGTKISLEVVYLHAMEDFVEDPFLKEERSLIEMLIEMIKVYFERREKRVELKEYKHALDIAAIVSISKVDGTFTYVNENFCKISKYQENELLGKHHNIIWSGFHPPEYFNELKYAMDGGNPYRKEFCNKAKDGTLYWVDSSIVPFLDDDGKVYQYLSISYDITETVLANSKIAESEEKYKDIVENSHDLIWSIDNVGNCTFLNKASKFICGYESEELLGKSFLDFIPKELKDKEIVVFSEIQKKNKEIINYENQFIHKDGHIIHLLTNARILQDGARNFIGLTGSSKDVTKQRRKEDELKTSEERFRVIVEGAPDPIFIQTNKCFVYLNKLAVELFGAKDEKELLGKPVLDYFHPDFHNKALERIKNLNIDRKTVYDPFEQILIQLNGNEVWVETKGDPIFYNGENGGLVFVRDITSRKNAESKMIQYKKSLQKLTTEMMLTEEKQRKEIAANIHDHLSQSLVISKMKLNDLWNDTEINERQNEIGTVIKHISEALENSRKITYDLCPPVLYELGLIEAIYWLAEKIEDQNQIKVKFETDFNDIKLSEPKLILIYRAIQEILNNAIKHSGANQINIRFTKYEYGLQIIVKDEGRGFDKSQLNSRSLTNSGFGLFAVRERIENLEGTFIINSTLGFGTEVKIFVPLKENKLL